MRGLVARLAGRRGRAIGVNVTAFALLKVAIAVTLMGIVVRLWRRVDSVKAALPTLTAKAEPEPEPRYGDIDTPLGRGRATQIAPGALPLHLMARLMWAPILAMGSMLVVAGLVLSIVQAQGAGSPDAFQTLGAWVQGAQFLGEGFILAGIAFLLGTILGSLRTGGSEVQASLGLVVDTLKMPRTTPRAGRGGGPRLTPAGQARVRRGRAARPLACRRQAYAFRVDATAGNEQAWRQGDGSMWRWSAAAWAVGQRCGRRALGAKGWPCSNGASSAAPESRGGARAPGSIRTLD